MTERLRGVPLSFEGFYRADFLGDNQWNIPGPEKTSGMPPYCLRWEYSKGSKRGGGTIRQQGRHHRQTVRRLRKTDCAQDSKLVQRPFLKRWWASSLSFPFQFVPYAPRCTAARVQEAGSLVFGSADAWLLWTVAPE